MSAAEVLPSPNLKDATCIQNHLVPKSSRFVRNELHSAYAAAVSDGNLFSKNITATFHGAAAVLSSAVNTLTFPIVAGTHFITHILSGEVCEAITDLAADLLGIVQSLVLTVVGVIIVAIGFFAPGTVYNFIYPASEKKEGSAPDNIEEIKSLKHELAEVTKECTAKQARIDELTAELETVRDEETRLKERIKENERAVTALQKQIDEKQGELDALQATVDERTKLLEEKESSLGGSRKLWTEEKERAKTLASRLDELRTELSEKDEEEARLKADLHAARGAVDALKKDLKALTEFDREQLRKDLDDVKANVPPMSEGTYQAMKDYLDGTGAFTVSMGGFEFNMVGDEHNALAFIARQVALLKQVHAAREACSELEAIDGEKYRFFSLFVRLLRLHECVEVEKEMKIFSGENPDNNAIEKRVAELESDAKLTVKSEFYSRAGLPEITSVDRELGKIKSDLGMLTDLVKPGANADIRTARPFLNLITLKKLIADCEADAKQFEAAIWVDNDTKQVIQVDLTGRLVGAEVVKTKEQLFQVVRHAIEQLFPKEIEAGWVRHLESKVTLVDPKSIGVIEGVTETVSVVGQFLLDAVGGTKPLKYSITLNELRGNYERLFGTPQDCLEAVQDKVHGAYTDAINANPDSSEAIYLGHVKMLVDILKGDAELNIDETTLFKSYFTTALREAARETDGAFAEFVDRLCYCNWGALNIKSYQDSQIELYLSKFLETEGRETGFEGEDLVVLRALETAKGKVEDVIADHNPVVVFTVINTILNKMETILGKSTLTGTKERVESGARVEDPAKRNNPWINSVMRFSTGDIKFLRMPSPTTGGYTLAATWRTFQNILSWGTWGLVPESHHTGEELQPSFKQFVAVAKERGEGVFTVNLQRRLDDRLVEEEQTASSLESGLQKEYDHFHSMIQRIDGELFKTERHTFAELKAHIWREFDPTNDARSCDLPLNMPGADTYKDDFERLRNFVHQKHFGGREAIAGLEEQQSFIHLVYAYQSLEMLARLSKDSENPIQYFSIHCKHGRDRASASSFVLSRLLDFMMYHISEGPDPMDPKLMTERLKDTVGGAVVISRSGVHHGHEVPAQRVGELLVSQKDDLKGTMEEFAEEFLGDFIPKSREAVAKPKQMQTSKILFAKTDKDIVEIFSQPVMRGFHLGHLDKDVIADVKAKTPNPETQLRKDFGRCTYVFDGVEFDGAVEELLTKIKDDDLALFQQGVAVDVVKKMQHELNIGGYQVSHDPDGKSTASYSSTDQTLTYTFSSKYIGQEDPTALVRLEGRIELGLGDDKTVKMGWRAVPR